LIRAAAIAGMVSMALVLTACTAAHVEPYTYQDNKEMTGKPGLFTGNHSEIAILRD
jgi:hypothetical protein